VKRNREKGQTLVEFALLLPILLLLIFGAIEFGRVFHAYHVITSAAREGARAAAVGKDNNAVESWVEEAVSSLVSNPDNVIIKTNDEYNAENPEANWVYFTLIEYDEDERRKPVDERPYEHVDVKVKGAVRLIIPVISHFLGETKIIESEARMRLEC
jgi:endo-1,4-beta-mannosidase